MEINLQKLMHGNERTSQQLRDEGVALCESIAILQRGLAETYVQWGLRGLAKDAIRSARMHERLMREIELHSVNEDL